MNFTPHFNSTTNLFTIYFGEKEFSSFTYTTRAEALEAAASLQQHFFPQGTGFSYKGGLL